ncbi:MAG: hypothetical protein ABEJ05_08090 [Haloglomus sp.]
MCRLSRRRLLQAGGTAVLGGLAGCSGVVSPLSTGESHLGEVHIENRDTTAHEVTLRVEWENEVVHDRTYTLVANDPAAEGVPSERPAATWPAEAGDFRVMARLDAGDWQTVTPEEAGYPDCYGALVYIEKTGQMAILTTTNSSWCPRSSDD